MIFKTRTWSLKNINLPLAGSKPCVNLKSWRFVVHLFTNSLQSLNVGYSRRLLYLKHAYISTLFWHVVGVIFLFKFSFSCVSFVGNFFTVWETMLNNMWLTCWCWLYMLSFACNAPINIGHWWCTFFKYNYYILPKKANEINSIWSSFSYTWTCTKSIACVKQMSWNSNTLSMFNFGVYNIESC